jgi:hypothetical protein
MDRIDIEKNYQIAQILGELAVVFNKFNMSFVEFYEMNLEDKTIFLSKLHPSDFFKVNNLYQLLVDLNFIHGWEI